MNSGFIQNCIATAEMVFLERFQCGCCSDEELDISFSSPCVESLTRVYINYSQRKYRYGLGSASPLVHWALFPRPSLDLKVLRWTLHNTAGNFGGFPPVFVPNTESVLQTNVHLSTFDPFFFFF